MYVEKLFVLPTQETRDLIEARFKELPVVIDYAALGVEIGSRMVSHQGRGQVFDKSPYFAAITPKEPTIEYRALPGSINVWYDSFSNQAWIILPLIPSPEMTARREEIGDAWGRVFVPYLALSSQFNNIRVKPRLNSIATGLIELRPVLTFNCETVLITESMYPSQNDFYQDYVNNGQHLIQKFLDVA